MVAPKMSNARRRATYADVLAAPENMVAEIVDGTLYTSPRPATPHANAETMMIADLVPAFHGPPGDPSRPGGWWILAEPELHLGEDVIVPDLAGWRRDRLPVLPNAAAIRQAPDWVAEVASPRTGALDRGRKMRVYAREGVAHMWIVDPLARTLEVYRREALGWLVVGGYANDDRVQAEPFAQLEVDLTRWWLATPAD